MRGLLAPGLRRQLAVWMAVVMVLCTALLFAAVYSGTGTELRRQIDQEIAGDARELAHNLEVSGARTPAELSAAASRYVGSQPFSASSTFLLVTVPGKGTVTNQPELLARDAPDDGESAEQQQEENELAGRVADAPYGYTTLPLEDVGDLRLIKNPVSVPGGLTAVVGAGEPLAAVHHAQKGVAGAFVLAGLLALAGAVIASLLIAARISRPLRRMADVAARVDGGDLHHRMHHEKGEGQEIEVLAESFNHMLDRLSEAFAGQRAFVADASHELRTPLTVIRGQLEVLAAQRDPDAEEVRRVERLVQAEIARISRLVDDLLLLARSEQTEFVRLSPIDLPPFVQELWDGVSLVASRRFELGPVPRGTLRADPDRLAQALRNLIGNAVEHTEPGDGLVRMNVTALPGGRIRFVIEDDGPGIPEDQLEKVFGRFHRTDSARDRASGGAGLGLAIVQAIADGHGGESRAGRSPEGGARVTLELPGFSPAGDRSQARQPVR